MTTSNKFIGTGYTFPIKLNSQGRPDIESGVKILYSSINLLLSWTKGRRFFKEGFGSLIDRVLEEPNDSISNRLLVIYVKEALQDYEKRIIINNVKVEKVDYIRSNVLISFSITDTKEEETMIYPYYKEIS